MSQERYVRFQTADEVSVSYGRVDGELITPLEKAPWYGIVPNGNQLKLGDARLRAPVEPSKILCIGLNYALHVEASQSATVAPKEPMVFLKPPSAIIGPGDAIIHPARSERVDYEAELALVIGQVARNISPDEADKVIFGYTCANDVTARDLQKTDGQWGRAKGFDTFCPVGPWVVPTLGSNKLNEIMIEGIHNKVVRQSGNLSQMIFDIPYLVSYLSSVFTLQPGDLILTGTPAGIAPMNPGDEIEVRISKIGSLVNHVSAERDYSISEMTEQV